MELFRKKLSELDLKKRLAVPTSVLPRLGIPEGKHNHDLDVVDEEGKLWRLRLSTRLVGYPKAVITSGWLEFASSRGLKPGDELTLCSKEDEGLFEINVLRQTSLESVAQVPKGTTEGELPIDDPEKFNELKRRCDDLFRQKDFVLLLKSYPMKVVDDSKCNSWISDVVSIKRDLRRLPFNDDDMEEAQVLFLLHRIEERLRRIEQTSLENVIDAMYLPASSNYQLESVYEKVSLGTLLQGIFFASEDSYNPSTSGATQESGSQWGLQQPKAIIEFAVKLTVRQVSECLNRRDARFIRIAGTKKEYVVETIRNDPAVRSVFVDVLRFRVAYPLPNLFDDSVGISLTLTGSLLLNLWSLRTAVLLEDENISEEPQVLVSMRLDDLNPYRGPLVIFTSKQAVDMEIRVEDHLVSWKLFVSNAVELVLSPELEEIAIDIVRQCDGHLLAIVMIARFCRLKPVTDVMLWKRLAQALNSQPYYEVDGINQAMANALTFIWERMNFRMRRCLMHTTIADAKGKHILRDSLLSSWMESGLVGTSDEANAFLKQLLDIFILQSVTQDSVQVPLEVCEILEKIIMRRMHTFILVEKAGKLTEAEKEVEWDAKDINLVDIKLSQLPESPNCPRLTALLLQRNSHLTAIPYLFFERMPVLHVLNLSHTSINSLPDSLVNLVELQQLILRGCSCLMMLPPEVGALHNLEVLDLEGTPLIELPEDTRNLVQLKSLTLSFYGHDNSSKEKLHSSKVIHPGTISNLSELKELKIDVDPDDERWDETMDEIVEEICGLEKLTCLSLYLPNIEMLWKRRAGGTSLIFYPLSQFTFNVGHHKNRITSRVPNEIEAHFKGWDKGLKIVKGRTISTETKAALKHASAFFLDSHATCGSLSDFGIGNMKQLKFCLLAECNRIRTIMDSEEEAGSCSGEPFAALPNVEFLILRYLKNVESIWRRQVGKHCLSNLKFLALHTCHNLRYVLHPSLLANLNKLEELIVEDCYEVTSLVLQTDGAASNSASSPLQSLLPSLKRMSLLSLPELEHISPGGLHIAAGLECAGFYDCPKLKKISMMEMSGEHLKKVVGETKWWDELDWSTQFQGEFSPIDHDRDLLTQLVEAQVIHLLQKKIE